MAAAAVAHAVAPRGVRRGPHSPRRSEGLEKGKLCSRRGVGRPGAGRGSRGRCFRPGGGPGLGLPAVAAAAAAACSW